MSSAISRISSVMRLRAFVLGVFFIRYLLHDLFLYGCCDLPLRRMEPDLDHIPQRGQFLGTDVLPLVLGETEKEDRPVFRAVGDHHAIAA